MLGFFKRCILSSEMGWDNFLHNGLGYFTMILLYPFFLPFNIMLKIVQWINRKNGIETNLNIGSWMVLFYIYFSVLLISVFVFLMGSNNIKFMMWWYISFNVIIPFCISLSKLKIENENVESSNFEKWIEE